MKEAFTPQTHSEFRSPAPEAQAGTVFRLTKPAATPRLEGGVLFMDGGRPTEGPPQSARPVAERRPSGMPRQEGRVRQTPEQLTAAWKDNLGDAWQNPDTRSTVQLAIKEGLSPEVRANAGIKGRDREDEKRLRAARAKEVLGRREDLSEIESEALMQAHEEAAGAKGKNGEDAGVGNYKTEQLLQKARRLRVPLDKEGNPLKDREGNPVTEVFNQEERRKLMEAGLVGVLPEDDPAIAALNPDLYVDAKLKEIAQQIRERGTSGRLDEKYLDPIIEDLNRLYNGGTVDREEAPRLYNQLNDLRLKANTGGGERRSRFSAEFEAKINEAQLRVQAYREAGSLRDAEWGPERQRLIKLISEIIETSPSPETQIFPGEVAKLASEFDETAEMLMSDLIFRSFQSNSETAHYEMTLYAGGNLDLLMGYIKQHASDHSIPAPERHEHEERFKYFLSLKSSAQLFHTMNGSIVEGNFKNFVEIARRITAKDVDILSRLPGIGDAMRVYEQAYQDFLATDGRITDTNYTKIKEQVLAELEKMNDKRLLTSGYMESRMRDGVSAEEAREMHEWEYERGYQVARTFMNVMFRSAETISMGNYPHGDLDPEEQFNSFPFENAVRVMNWPAFMVRRFRVGDKKGGLKYLDKIEHRFREQLVESGKSLGINRITKLGGTDVKAVEFAGLFGQSGVYSGWRLESMAFPQMTVTIGGETTSVRDWFNQKVDPHGPSDGPTINEKIKDLQKKGDGKKLTEILTPLIESTDIALSFLLKRDQFGGKVGYEARTKLWQRVAEKNVPIMIDYLTGLKIQGNGVKDLETIKADMGLTGEDWDISGVRSDGTANSWQEFKSKMLQLHELQIKQSLARMGKGNMEGAEDIAATLTPAERALMTEVITQGKNLAPHLADIVFPFLPFGNDLPYEILDYNAPGSTFLQRRLGSDLPSFSEAQGGAMPLIANPGGVGIEDALKALLQVKDGIESPNGDEDAQTRVEPIALAWIDMVMTNPGDRQVLLKGLKEFAHVPTSYAQKLAGVDAESITESQVRDLLEEGLKMGLFNHETVANIKKKKHVGIVYLIWSILRDVGVIIPVIAAKEIGDELLEGVSQDVMGK